MEQLLFVVGISFLNVALGIVLGEGGIKPIMALPILTFVAVLGVALAMYLF